MPVCCVKNCRSRTDRGNKENYNVSLYYFPKECELRRKWLEACERKEGEIKINCGEFIFQMLQLIFSFRIMMRLYALAT